MTGHNQSKLPSEKEELFQRESISFLSRPRSRGSSGARCLCLGQQGQSLVEVAIMIPIFTVLVCYAVDFGFFFLVATSLNSAARNAMEYSIQGTSSPAQAAEPAATVISNLALASIGLSGASNANVSVQVCSSSVGVNASNNTTRCTSPSTGAGAVTGTPDIDPESPTFQLNRVDVLYTFTPLLPIPASIFPTTTFHRMVEMRGIQ
jgi:Flp pilus assembly protein TadG